MVRLPEYIQTRLSQLAPRRLNHASIAGLALTLTVAVGGCATSPDQVVVEPSPTPTPETVSPSETAPPPVAANPDKADPVNPQPDAPADFDRQLEGEDELVTISVYTIDDECNEFVAQTVEVPSGQAMNAAVGQVFSETELSAFKLDGYQINMDGSTAIVDMRLAEGSERQFVSLSSCEQRSLLGGVEETLLNNPDWAVDSVKFTNDGKELVL